MTENSRRYGPEGLKEREAILEKRKAHNAANWQSEFLSREGKRAIEESGGYRIENIPNYTSWQKRVEKSRENADKRMQKARAKIDREYPNNIEKELQDPKVQRDRAVREFTQYESYKNMTDVASGEKNDYIERVRAWLGIRNINLENRQASNQELSSVREVARTPQGKERGFWEKANAWFESFFKPNPPNKINFSRGVVGRESYKKVSTKAADATRSDKRSDEDVSDTKSAA